MKGLEEAGWKKLPYLNVNIYPKVSFAGTVKSLGTYSYKTSQDRVELAKDIYNSLFAEGSDLVIADRTNTVIPKVLITAASELAPGCIHQPHICLECADRGRSCRYGDGSTLLQRCNTSEDMLSKIFDLFVGIPLAMFETTKQRDTLQRVGFSYDYAHSSAMAVRYMQYPQITLLSGPIFSLALYLTRFALWTVFAKFDFDFNRFSSNQIFDAMSAGGEAAKKLFESYARELPVPMYKGMEDRLWDDVLWVWEKDIFSMFSTSLDDNWKRDLNKFGVPKSFGEWIREVRG